MRNYWSHAKAELVEIHDEHVILNLPFYQQVADHKLHEDSQSKCDMGLVFFLELGDVDHDDGPVLVVPAGKVEGSWVLYRIGGTRMCII